MVAGHGIEPDILAYETRGRTNGVPASRGTWNRTTGSCL